MSDHSFTSDRGLTHWPEPVPGWRNYAAVEVHGSSNAEAPCIWLELSGGAAVTQLPFASVAALRDRLGELIDAPSVAALEAERDQAREALSNTQATLTEVLDLFERFTKAPHKMAATAWESDVLAWRAIAAGTEEP